MAAASVRVASGKQLAMAAEESGSDVRGEAARGEQPWKKFVYVEPSRRVKEILKEELNFQKEACHLKHPAAVVNCLETVCSVRKNVAIGSLKVASQNRNCSLLQPRFYSRHAGFKTRDEEVTVQREQLIQTCCCET